MRNEPTIYSAAVYCRLSKDDKQAGESVSIETQEMTLEDFCCERGFSIYEIYADDGCSELNCNRPAFTRLLEDILIEQIEIGHTVKVDGCRQQEITIVYRFIGAADEI